VTTRFPRDLASEMDFVPVATGCYDVKYLTGTIRVLVINDLPCEQQNAVMHLFSNEDALVRYAASTFRRYSEKTGGLLMKLLEFYNSEGILMPLTLEEVNQHVRERLLSTMTPAERLEGLTPNDVVQVMPPEQLAELIRSAQRKLDESHKPPQSGE